MRAVDGVRELLEALRQVHVGVLAAIAKRAHLTLLVPHQHDVYCADPDRRRILADLRRPGRGVPIVQQSGLCGFVSRPRAPGAPLIIFPRPKQLGHVVHRLPSLREWQKCIPYTMKGSSFDCRYVTTLVFETATRPKSGWGGQFVTARISVSSASVRLESQSRSTRSPSWARIASRTSICRPTISLRRSTSDSVAARMRCRWGLNCAIAARSALFEMCWKMEVRSSSLAAANLEELLTSHAAASRSIARVTRSISSGPNSSAAMRTAAGSRSLRTFMTSRSSAGVGKGTTYPPPVRCCSRPDRKSVVKGKRV